MGFAKEIYQAVNAAFEQRREQAKGLLEERKEEVYQKSPRLAQIEGELRETAGELLSAAARGELSSARLDQIKGKNLALRAERGRILTGLGYEADYLTLPVCCETCRDQGFIGNRMCGCYETALKEEAYRRSTLALAMPEADFDHFNLDLYDGTTDETGQSPRSRAQSIKEICEGYVRKFGDRNLLFFGPTGLGKTFLSGCISKELIKKGVYVLYETAYAVFSAFEKEKFSSGGQKEELTSPYFDCQLLIIDDLGTEMVTNFTTSAFYNLINTRMLHKRPTIISTNLNPDEMERIYGPRVMSRLGGEFEFLRFCGDDIRPKLRR